MYEPWRKSTVISHQITISYRLENIAESKVLAITPPLPSLPIQDDLTRILVSEDVYLFLYYIKLQLYYPIFSELYYSLGGDTSPKLTLFMPDLATYLS